MQSGYKTSEAKLMLKTGEDRYYHRKFEKDGRIPNWKSPGLDLVQGFWLTNSSSLHDRVRLQLKECLDKGFVPSWLTSLLQKDKNKSKLASNYRPITFLPLMWNLLTGVIADQIYKHLDQERLLP